MATEKISAAREDDVSQVERVLSSDDIRKDHMNYDRVDGELAKYASDAKLEVSPEDNKRLKRQIDKRVLSIMIFTYFLQALDKGTLSFAAIMGIRKDANLVGQQVSLRNPQTTTADQAIVRMAHNMHLHFRAHC